VFQNPAVAAMRTCSALTVRHFSAAAAISAPRAALGEGLCLEAGKKLASDGAKEAFDFPAALRG
jgi:hypothetical protein